jgi:hypothetical protein
MNTMTNAELAAAIESAAHHIRSTAETEVQHHMFKGHLSELLRIQRERAGAQTDVGKVPARLPEWPNGGGERQLTP